MKAQATCWMAKAPGDHLRYIYSGYTREFSRERVLKQFPKSMPWKKLYKAGWRIVRVAVREL